jgi:hypothetical protein
MYKIFIPVFTLLFTLSACTQGAGFNPSPTPASGVEGTVTEGPMCPGPVRVGQNNCPDQPYPATISILTSDNTQVAQTQADANGFFIIPLEPGTYTIHPISGKPLPRAADQTVVVTAGEYTKVSIVYDTGMR